MKQHATGLRLTTLILSIFTGLICFNVQALARSPHVAGLTEPDTGPLSDYVNNARNALKPIVDGAFANEFTYFDVMDNQIDAAKAAVEACDRAAYDAAMAKIDALTNTLNGLVSDGQGTMGGLVGPGSIANTVDDLSKPFDQRARSLERRKAAAEKALDKAAKAHHIGPVIVAGLGAANALPADLAGPWNEIQGYDQALAELSGMTQNMRLLLSDYRRIHKQGEEILKALKKWQSKLEAARAGIPPFPENCGGQASDDNFIGLGGVDSTFGNFLAFGGGLTGQVNRYGTHMLGLDNGISILPNNLLHLDNDGDVNGFFVGGAFDTTGIANQLWGDWFQIDPSTRFSTGLNLVHIESNVDQQIGNLSTGANNGLIFSPQGQSGGLGGGLNIGNRDFENLAYSNDYSANQYNLNKQMSFENGPVTITPGVQIGYGQTEIAERFSGEVVGINENFAYQNDIDIETFLIGAGVSFEAPIEGIGTPVSFYGGVSGQLLFNDQSGHSTLSLDGLVTAQETQNLGGSETTGALEANLGLSIELGSGVEFVIGGAVQQFETPGIEIRPGQEAQI
ncbi:MAG: autotransporter outer membrane beta-barrel domain-containing protein, partial [Fimbriimonadaceae bacterium]|nr:autotransporter outer membrane beta-barrel domain-containing protein [Alphaproteobacteria bacterium]